MFRKLGLLCAALAFFSMAGGHFVALQTIAWAKMLRDSTERTGSLAVAVQQTFDGQHPCELCVEIASARRHEAKAPVSAQKDASNALQIAKAEKSDKATLLEMNLPPARIVAASLRWHLQPYLDGPLRDEQPPTPPPRAFCA